MKRIQGQTGFTLIEIMVVVFILGLLVTLVAPKIIGRVDDARIVKAKADIKGIEQALNMFKLDNGFYPPTLDALLPGSGPNNAKNFNPDGYLDKVPIDPWGNPYIYTSDARGHPVIKSYGADGQEGGDGKNADISSADL